MEYEDSNYSLKEEFVDALVVVDDADVVVVDDDDDDDANVVVVVILVVVVSFIFSLHLLIDSPIITSISVPSNQHVEGQMASLTCTVDENPAPADSVTWQLDGVVVTGSSFSNPVSTLNVNTSQSTAGNYHCVANNGIGEEAVSDERPLTVLCKYCISILQT